MVGRIRAVSDDSASVSLMAARNIGGVYFPCGCFTVASGAGYSGTVPWKDVLEDLNTGQPLTLAPGESLCVKPSTSVSDGKNVWLHLEGAPL